MCIPIYIPCSNSKSPRNSHSILYTVFIPCFSPVYTLATFPSILAKVQSSDSSGHWRASCMHPSRPRFRALTVYSCIQLYSVTCLKLVARTASTSLELLLFCIDLQLVQTRPKQLFMACIFIAYSRQLWLDMRRVLANRPLLLTQRWPTVRVSTGLRKRQANSMELQELQRQKSNVKNPPKVQFTVEQGAAV
jgi:hypothetical protein